MLGRAACDDPWMLARVDSLYYGQPDPVETRFDAADAIRDFLEAQCAQGVPPRAILRHLLGLFNGLPGARAWRRTLSDSATLADWGPATLDQALRRMART